MLKLSIKNPTTQETETYDVVTEFNQFFDRAKEYGLINSIFSLKVKEMKAEDAPIPAVMQSTLQREKVLKK